MSLHKGDRMQVSFLLDLVRPIIKLKQVFRNYDVEMPELLVSADAGARLGLYSPGRIAGLNIRTAEDPQPGESLVLFLYLLTRDKLPSGAVERILQDVEKAKGQDTRYTSSEVETLARGWAKELTK